MNLDSPIVQMVILAVAVWMMRRAFLREGASPTAAGAIVMAAGIFGLAAMQKIPAIPSQVAQLFALGLLVVWSHIAASYVVCGLQGRMATHTASPSDSLAVGTWVAGTAVMARMLLLGVPSWRGAAIAMAIAASVLWLWYLFLVLRGFRAIMAAHDRLRATGRILLSAVSTQSLALVAWDLVPHSGFLHALVAGLIVLGFLLYGVGLVLIIQRYRRATRWTLAEDWDNTNCILHGAMSISGLAIAYTGVLPEALGIATWFYVLAVFVAVEVIEVARMIMRLRDHGLRRGIFTYHVSQWSRNFTFGMFYAFTLALAPALASHPSLSPIVPFVGFLIAYGPYLVLFFLLMQTGLWISANAEFGARISRHAVAER